MNSIIKSAASVLLAASLILGTGCRKSPEDSSAAEISQVEQTNAKVSIDGNKFMVDGKELWINGANTPWHYWNDFTGNFNYEWWDATFAQLASDGINATRIWINCNGEGTVQLRRDGTVLSIKEEHWDDLSKLFEIASNHHVYVMATLTSFDHFKSSGSAGEHWRSMITSKEGVDSFAESYVKPFCEKFGEEEYLFSIDLMNEPDWVNENTECGQIAWDDLAYFFGKCASVIHDACSTPVTVGMGIIKYNSEKYEGNKIADSYLTEITGLDNATIDFYSTHYYMWQKPYFGFPFTQSPQDFGLDASKPCLIGEASNDDAEECGLTLTEKYTSAYDNGWNGVMIWMEPRTDEELMWYRYDLTETAANAMYELIPEKIDPLDRLSISAAADSAA